MTDVVAASFDLATIAPGDLQKKNKQFFFALMLPHRIYGGAMMTVKRGKTTDRITIIVGKTLCIILL
jgi:hypothetical protein